MQHILEDLKQNKKILGIANIALTTITNKRRSPDIDLITKLKERYDKGADGPYGPYGPSGEDKLLKERIEDNPLFKLSIEDYENMCKDESIKVIIAKALNINIRSLTTFCKNVNIFKDNIDSSPNTIKEKMKIKKLAIEDLSPALLNGQNEEPLKLNHLPEDILKHITQNSLKSLFRYKLEDGIPEDKLDESALCENPNALYYLITNGKQIDYFRLSSNPNPLAIKLLEEEIRVNPTVHIDWDVLSASKNPKAIKLLEAHRDKINWDLLSGNTNPKAIEILAEEYKNNPNSHKLVWPVLCGNPKAIKLLEDEYKNYPKSDKLVWSALCGNTNPKVFKLLEKEVKVFPRHIDLNALAANETDEAIKFLENIVVLENIEYSKYFEFWEKLSLNPKAIKILKANKDKIVWLNISHTSSPEGIALLRENYYKINWSALAHNPLPEAIALLKENYRKIDINWEGLSQNPSPEAIILLEKEFAKKPNNPKFLWRMLSSNVNAINLLHKRMIYENKLSQQSYNKLTMYNIINWLIVSSNPNAIELIKERIKYQNLPENRNRNRIESLINWEALSKNPSIFTIE
jgi:hypothetical protein